MNYPLSRLLLTCAAVGLALRSVSAMPDEAGTISPATEEALRNQYKQLIDAENAHDIVGVRRMVWDSPAALFVAKTKTTVEWNWAGFWGRDVVVNHIGELFQGTFVMTPDYSREKVVQLHLVRVPQPIHRYGSSQTKDTVPYRSDNCRKNRPPVE
jgi:hypothetical protein